MRDVLQILGVVLGVVSAIVVDINAILKYKSSQKDKIAEAWLFEEIFFGSAVGVAIIVVILLISLLF